MGQPNYSESLMSFADMYKDIIYTYSMSALA